MSFLRRVAIELGLPTDGKSDGQLEIAVMTEIAKLKHIAFLYKSRQ